MVVVESVVWQMLPAEIEGRGVTCAHDHRLRLEKPDGPAVPADVLGDLGDVAISCAMLLQA